MNNVIRDENGKELGEFRVGELFDMKLGMQVKDMSNTGELRVITGNTMTHGVAGYINEELDSRFVFKDKITVAMRGQGGKCYYQKGKFLAGHNSMVLLPKNTENFNDSTANYIVSALNKLPFSGYNNYPTLSTYGNYTVLLPLTPENTPDWEYMESYISTIEHKYLNTVKAFNDKEMRLLQKLYGVDSDLHIQEPEYGYGDFKVGELFDVKSTNSGIDKNKLMLGEEEVPYITRSEKNNGLTLYIPDVQHEKYKKNSGNVITIGLDTQTANYQPYDFYTGQNVNIIDSKHMNKNVAMYLITKLKRIMGKYNWGNMGATLGRLKKDTISLPVTPENTPDWEYMEKYISIIAQREREKIAKYITTKQSR